MRVEEQHNVEQPLTASGPQTTPGANHAGQPRRRWVVVVLALAVVATVVISGIVPRVRARAALRAETNQLAVPAVIVVQPKRAAPGQEIVLPANVQAFKDAPIYARTNGYLKRWYADIGAHVRQGQLLAEIDTPEVDQQLHQARADLTTAEANVHLSEITANRYQGLLRSDSVSQQDADNATGDFAAKKAIVQSAQANVRRLEDLQSFQRIYAPFDGVITARNTDVGQLIDSGSSGGATRELFHIAAVSRLRVYVNVPQVYSPQIKAGLHAQLTLAEFPGRHFDGMVVRDTGAIDNTTRTLLTEIDVNNPTGELKPGGYVGVHLTLPTSDTTFTLPVNAIIFKSAGMQVATVKDGKNINLVSIAPGRDFGTEMEVLAGLKGDESVVINPPDSLTSGEPVRVAQTQSVAGGKR